MVRNGGKTLQQLERGKQKRDLFILKPALRMFGALCFGNYDSWRVSDTKREYYQKCEKLKTVKNEIFLHFQNHSMYEAKLSRMKFLHLKNI